MFIFTKNATITDIYYMISFNKKLTIYMFCSIIYKI